MGPDAGLEVRDAGQPVDALGRDAHVRGVDRVGEAANGDERPNGEAVDLSTKQLP